MEKREEGGWESAHIRYSMRINSWLGQCRELNLMGAGRNTGRNWDVS